MNASFQANRRLRLGFVGGGPDSGIGPMHRHAALLDGQFDLVAGAFSTQSGRNEAAGRAYGVGGERIYASFAEMAEREARRPDEIGRAHV